jgi:hypothetical protein
MASPASILALSQDWKLTLPTGSSNSPTEITQPKLATYADANFRAATDHVLFTAKCGGVTTSGSGYPRSELREMRNGGKDKAAWANSSGTHIMSVDQAFTHLPVVKPHVVASQIHGADDDITACRLEGSKLWITEGDNTHFHLLTASYVLGTRFTLQWTARPGGIDFNYNSGAVTGTVPGNYSGCYFKAGCYTQSSTSKGDSSSAYGEVAMYQLVMGPLPPKPARPAAPKPPPDDENPCGG